MRVKTIQNTEHVEGNRFQDDRGVLIYNNDFDMAEVKRSYIIDHDRSFIRAFHGHIHEKKWCQVLEGKFRVVTCKLIEDGYKYKSTEKICYRPDILSIQVFYLESDGDVLAIPAGFTNGFQNITTSGKIQFFSDKTVDESVDDDIRSRWDCIGDSIWNLEQYR